MNRAHHQLYGTIRMIYDIAMFVITDAASVMPNARGVSHLHVEQCSSLCRLDNAHEHVQPLSQGCRPNDLGPSVILTLRFKVLTYNYRI